MAHMQQDNHDNGSEKVEVCTQQLLMHRHGNLIEEKH